MITATEISPGRFAVKTSIPVNGRIQCVPVTNEAEATRLANRWTRLYIVEKLSSWLLQRRFAFGIAGMTKICMLAQHLFNQIIAYESHSLTQVCRWVIRHENDLLYLAPRQKSAHYKGYQNTIVPILQFCKEWEGVAQ